VTTIADRRRLWATGAAAAWLVAALGYLIMEAVAVAGRPDYSYGRNFISDLGVPSASPLAWVMNTAFCLQGTFFLLGAALIAVAFGSRQAGMFLVFAAMNAVGNITVAAVHSGPIAHADGTIWLHETGALLAIVGGNAAIMAGAFVVGRLDGPRWYRRLSVGIGALGLFSFLMLVLEMKGAPPHAPPPAVWERASVYSIIAGQMITAAHLLIRNQWARHTRCARAGASH
jgi:hypothetical membrane protein